MGEVERRAARRSSARRRRSSRAHWAGLRLIDGFRYEAAYYERLAAQRRFYDMAAEAQRVAARVAGVPRLVEPKAKVQIGPCYERSFPVSHLAVHAAIGLTAFLEFRAHAGAGVLDALLRQELERASYETRLARYDLFVEVCKTLTGLLERRLQFHLLERDSGLVSVTLYRVYLASHRQRLDSLEGIARALILFGDLLSELEDLAGVGRLHPSSETLYRRLERATAYLESRLWRDLTEGGEPADLLDVAEAVLPPLLGAVAELWPRRIQWAAIHDGFELDVTAPIDVGVDVGDDVGEGALGRTGDDRESTRDRGIDMLLGLMPPGESDHLGGGAQLSPPLIEASARGAASSDGSLDALRRALDGAVGHGRATEDIRSDLLAEQLLETAFEAGPLEEVAVSGHEVGIRFEGHDLRAEVFDSTVPLSNDLLRHEQLLQEASRFERSLEKLLYLNPEESVAFEDRQSGGVLDPGRLVLAQASDVVFRRARRFTRPADGASILTILCDMSGSMVEARTRLLQVLAMAWVRSARGRRVRVLTAAHDIGRIRSSPAVTRVHWAVHPEKVPSSIFEATRSIASLPEKGAGGQADAASIHHVLSEALRLARGARVYMILISDTGWCRSFPGAGLSPGEEIGLALADLRARHPGQLHTTLVAFDQCNKEGLGQGIDDVLQVSTTDPNGSALAAEQIALHVARRIRSDRRFTSEHFSPAPLGGLP